MSYYAALVAPLAVLLPSAGAVDSMHDMAESPITIAKDGVEELPPRASSFRLAVDSLRALQANQVRIERQVTIRISPLPSPVRPNMLMDLPRGEITSRMVERKMGKCVKASRIAGVQPEGGNRLLLFMRDQRIVSAELERSCRSRDFYSGFYLSKSSDGQLCVDRDMLFSRSGANCRLTRIRQMVESDE